MKRVTLSISRWDLVISHCSITKLAVFESVAPQQHTGISMSFSCRKATCTCHLMHCYLMCTNLPSAYRKSQAELREQIDQLSEGNSVNMLIQGSITHLNGEPLLFVPFLAWLGSGMAPQVMCTD